MKYLNKSFTMPTTNRKMTDLEYDLAVGNITQEEYDQRKPKPAKRGGKKSKDVSAPAAG